MDHEPAWKVGNLGQLGIAGLQRRVLRGQDPEAGEAYGNHIVKGLRCPVDSLELTCKEQEVYKRVIISRET